MDLVLYSPKSRQPKLQSYIGATSAYQHVVHFNTMAGIIVGIANFDSLKIQLFTSTLQEPAFD